MCAPAVVMLMLPPLEVTLEPISLMLAVVLPMVMAPAPLLMDVRSRYTPRRFTLAWVPLRVTAPPVDVMVACVASTASCPVAATPMPAMPMAPPAVCSVTPLRSTGPEELMLMVPDPMTVRLLGLMDWVMSALVRLMLPPAEVLNVSGPAPVRSTPVPPLVPVVRMVRFSPAGTTTSALVKVPLVVMP